MIRLDPNYEGKYGGISYTFNREMYVRLATASVECVHPGTRVLVEAGKSMTNVIEVIHAFQECGFICTELRPWTRMSE